MEESEAKKGPIIPSPVKTNDRKVSDGLDLHFSVLATRSPQACLYQ